MGKVHKQTPRIATFGELRVNLTTAGALRHWVSPAVAAVHDAVAVASCGIADGIDSCYRVSACCGFTSERLSISTQNELFSSLIMSMWSHAGISWISIPSSI